MKVKPKLNKITDVPYNETLTIALIEKDELLRTTFGSELKLPFSLLITLSKEGKLENEDTKSFLRCIFEDVILTQSELIRKYRELANANNIDLAEVKSIPETPTPPTVTEEVTEKTAEIVAEIPKKEKPKKESAIPRRYGKEKIMADITKQGGKPTPLQTAMLRVNDLKNLWVNLQARGVKDMVGGTNLLSDADCRDITSAITIMERRLETILKRKK